MPDRLTHSRLHFTLYIWCFACITIKGSRVYLEWTLDYCMLRSGRCCCCCMCVYNFRSVRPSLTLITSELSWWMHFREGIPITVRLFYALLSHRHLRLNDHSMCDKGPLPLAHVCVCVWSFWCADITEEKAEKPGPEKKRGIRKKIQTRVETAALVV